MALCSPGLFIVTAIVLFVQSLTMFGGHHRQPAPAPEPDDGTRTYVSVTGIDYAGNDLWGGFFTGGTLDQCKTSCDNTPGCRLFMFMQDDLHPGTCYTKGAPSVATLEWSGAIFMPVSQSSPYAAFPGIDFPESYLTIATYAGVGTASECMMKCDATPRCTAASYWPATRVCRTKTGQGPDGSVACTQQASTIYLRAGNNQFAPSPLSPSPAGRLYASVNNIDYAGNDLWQGFMSGSTVDQCKDSCEMTLGCNLFMFFRPGGICYTKAALSTPTTNPGGVVYMPVSLSNQYSAFPGIDFAEASLNIATYINVLSATACAAKCGAMPGCTVFSFYQAMSSCYLKSGQGTVAFTPASTAYVLAGAPQFAPLEPPAQPVGPRSYVSVNDIDYWGNDLWVGYFNHGNLDQCKTSCDITPGCSVFMFMHPDGTCYTKAALSSPTYNPGGTFYMAVAPFSRYTAFPGIDFSESSLNLATFTGVQSAAACASKCDATQGCTVYSFWQYSGTCNLKSGRGSPLFKGESTVYVRAGLAPAPAGLQPTQAQDLPATLGPSTADCQYPYTAVPGVDVSGADLQSGYSEGVTLSQCRQACDAAAACKAFRFLPPKGQCYLKGDFGSAIVISKNSTVYVRCITPERVYTKMTGLAWPGNATDFPTGTHHDIPSMELCLRICDNTSICMVLFYDQANQTCIARTGFDGEPVPAPGGTTFVVTSGNAGT